ncbi:hypothetical protein LBM341_00153 [Ralstonia solanacearum]|nr:hypothetical protein LBM341_00153 [Ralstonia solanacearum]NKA07483.1 hypothetical protein [Ralstonia solanacearum]
MRPTPQAEFELNALSRQKQTDLIATRELAARAFSVESIQRLTQEGLLTLQRTLQHGEVFGIWVTPPAWEPHGSARALLSIDLRRRIEHHLSMQLVDSESDRRATIPGQWLDHAVLTLSRYLILLRMGPAGLYSRKIYRPLDPNTITDIAYGVGPALLACALAKRVAAQMPDDATTGDASSESPLLSAVQLADLDLLTKSTRQRTLLECQRMRMLSELDLWWDVPSLGVTSSAQAMTGPARTNDEPDERSPHLPLPDEYVAEMARKSLWIAQDLAPKDGVQNSFRRTESSKRSGCVTDDAKPDANGTLRAAWRGRFPPARGGFPSCAGLTHQSPAHHPQIAQGKQRV